MMEVKPIVIDNRTFLAVSVELPKTTLIAIMSDIGYIMCGALDVGLLNDKLKDRKIIAGRAVGVRSVEDLLNAALESVTDEAEQRGIKVGMIGKEALLRM
ncbi:DUF1805 domain-containing protein [Caldibacillus lycopersici]|uniref:DUF1805 domain-containing protein n=1 Tax=Perspicuibacillus lycopersici TaxID=1325689 RepID=A0AAE3LPY6_9BACI|nr:DUF1805 domain-containing protein [Perspicuibacillus lycopersici]MCU9612834.1 DUF1805 domain-containing protein [Perspicuibacillus lycopersici]